MWEHSYIGSNTRKSERTFILRRLHVLVIGGADVQYRRLLMLSSYQLSLIQRDFLMSAISLRFYGFMASHKGCLDCRNIDSINDVIHTTRNEPEHAPSSKCLDFFF